MKRATEVLGLKVMGIREGRDKGIIQDVMINAAEKSVEYYIVKDSRGYGFYAIARKDVIGVGADYAVTPSIENVKKLYESRELLEATEKGFYMLGAAAISNAGDIIGEVNDFSYSGKNGEIQKLFLDNGNEFLADKIAALAGSTVFLNLGDEPFATSVTAKSMGIEEESIQFLLGKTVKSAVVSEDRQFSVDQDTVLTQEILEEAARHDAILILTLNV